jgi:hypothetical protein
VPDIVNRRRSSTAVVCIAALGAAIIAGRVILVVFVPDGWRLLASALS